MAWFGYDGPGDSPAYVRPTAGGAVTTYVVGPRGMVAIDVAGTVAYPVANGHGDIVGNTDAAGAFTAEPSSDEFGRGPTPARRLGWLGSHQRYSTGGSLGLVRMGVRMYDPGLGRFLQADPVEGGSANDYDYVGGDPVNIFDLAGTAANRGDQLSWRELEELAKKQAGKKYDPKIVNSAERKLRQQGKYKGDVNKQKRDSERRDKGTIKAVGIGGLLGGAVWWGAKVFSPACGPAAALCAVAL